MIRSKIFTGLLMAFSYCPCDNPLLSNLENWICLFPSRIETYQSERAKDRQTLHIGKAQLHQTQTNDNSIKDVPALLKVIVRVQSKDLQHHLRCEDSSEHLVSKNKTLHLKLYSTGQTFGIIKKHLKRFWKMSMLAKAAFICQKI